MFERIPKELKEEGLFCLYKMEQRKGKTTKVPYQVNGCREILAIENVLQILKLLRRYIKRAVMQALA